MNSPLVLDQVPNPPTVSGTEKYAGLAGSVIRMGKAWAELTRYLQTTLNNIKQQLNNQVQGVGAALASGATITVSNAIHHVTGVATISKINAPSGFSGPLWLVADGAFAITTGGNIAHARGPFTVGTVVMLIFDPATALWYPA